MTDVSRYDPDAEAEGQRLRAEARRERDNEMTEQWPDSPLVQYVKTHPYDAAAQIEALQEAVLMWVPTAHYGLPSSREHHYNFAECDNAHCRKLRDRLRPMTEASTYAP